MCWCRVLCFFFQAEDGIRDAQESRGLGDVYKRQEYGTISTTLASRGSATAGAHGSGGGAAAPAGGNGNGGVDVASYVKHHRIHVLLDKLVKDLLTEKPADSAAWMLSLIHI
eukprot:TRINITY_DN11480_c0_g1_i1.p1 TRINITY_DN11480_c0_g1~~TRINITY_DN11480_c0_g1_i1.p1  ORF type:complete len:112 (+),score=25.35 TRINITY_DN11480_c0_g1_i1:52-387(+)